VVLIDKEIGSPVGVGEGTLLSFENIMRRCGFDTPEWFHEIDATVKAGILFPGWGEGKYKDVWHPFYFALDASGNGISSYDSWTKHQNYNFNKYSQFLYDLSIEHDGIDQSALQYAYAFHIDAGKLVTFFQEKLENRPQFTFIKSEVVDISRKEDNHISSLTLKNNKTVSGDLYIDCTGFKRLLDYEPDSVTLEGRLFCDTALAAHVPYRDKRSEIHPYVISEQIDHGWIWNIPVQSRIGSGMVFNRSVTDIEEAKEYFVNYWNNRIEKEKLKVIDWTPYYNKNMWHENVVSIGLSGGFIEPLESTGVAMIIVGVEQLAFAIQSTFYTESSVKYFNNLMSGYYEHAIDFVSMHYAKSNKNTKFWNWVRNTFVKSERQEFYESQMLRKDIRLPITGEGYMFSSSNWFCWLIQMGYPITSKADFYSDEQSEEFLKSIYNEEQRRIANRIHHFDYLEKLKKIKS